MYGTAENQISCLKVRIIKITCKSQLGEDDHQHNVRTYSSYIEVLSLPQFSGRFPKPSSMLGVLGVLEVGGGGGGLLSPPSKNLC